MHSGQQKRVPCKVCNKQIQPVNMPQHLNMSRHLLTHQEGTISCPLQGCNVRFADKSYIKRHLLSRAHTQGVKKECSVCHAKVLELNQHMKIHDVDRKKYPCPECKKLFASTSNLKKHRLIHSQKHQTECPICKMMCSSIKAHILYVHEKKGKRSCPKCGVQVRTLKRHMEIKHGRNEKKSCLICNKKFLHLKLHMKMHDPDRKTLSCPQCQMLFRCKLELSVHVKSHDKSRKMFSCVVCQKLFTNKRNMKKHELSHDG